MKINNVFNFGQTVYLVTDKEQLPHLVTAIKVMPTAILYELSHCARHSYRYEFEMSAEKDTVLMTSN